VKIIFCFIKSLFFTILKMASMEVTETETTIKGLAPVTKTEETKSNQHNATGDFGISTSPEHEQFVGFKLTNEEKEYIWDPEVTPVTQGLGLGGSTSILQVNQYSRLLVKQAILSPDAKDGELNCVEVEGSFPRSLNKMPLAILVGGKDMQRYLDVYFPEPPLTFRLTHGTGPVYILAQSMIENSADDSDDELEDDEDTAADTADEEEAAPEDEEEAEAEDSPVKSKKRKATKAPAKGRSKKNKVEPEVAEDEEEDQEEEESEEEAAEPSPPKKRGKMAKAGKAKPKGKPAKVEVEVEAEDEEEEESEDEPEPEPPKKKGRAAIKAKPKAAKRK